MTNQKQFGGRTYSFGHIPPMEAVLVEVSIARAIGEPIFKALVGARDLLDTSGAKDRKLSEDEMAKQAIPVFATAIGLLAKNLEPSELQNMMRIVMRRVSCDGEFIEGQGAKGIDSVFAQRNRELWEVFVYGLRFNFQDFFPESLTAGLKARASKAFNSLSRPTSTGTSGDQ